jgi:hypothetical protein
MPLSMACLIKLDKLRWEGIGEVQLLDRVSGWASFAGSGCIPFKGLTWAAAGLSKDSRQGPARPICS